MPIGKSNTKEKQQVMIFQSLIGLKVDYRYSRLPGGADQTYPKHVASERAMFGVFYNTMDITENRHKQKDWEYYERAYDKYTLIVLRIALRADGL